MTLRLIPAALLLLSLPGCVAIPLIAQVAAGGNSMAQLCSMAKMPGQNASLCERFTPATATQAPGNAPAAKTVAWAAAQTPGNVPTAKTVATSDR